MKKLLYSSLLLVGLFASYQMDAVAAKSGEAQESRLDQNELSGRIDGLIARLHNKNYDLSRSATLKDRASDIAEALAPERNKQETIESLKRSQKALNVKQHSKRKLTVVADKIQSMEQLS